MQRSTRCPHHLGCTVWAGWLARGLLKQPWSKTGLHMWTVTCVAHQRDCDMTQQHTHCHQQSQPATQTFAVTLQNTEQHSSIGHCNRLTKSDPEYLVTSWDMRPRREIPRNTHCTYAGSDNLRQNGSICPPARRCRRRSSPSWQMAACSPCPNSSASGAAARQGEWARSAR